MIFPVTCLGQHAQKTDKSLHECYFWQKTFTSDFNIYPSLIWLYSITKITVAHNVLVRLWTGLHPSTPRI